MDPPTGIFDNSVAIIGNGFHSFLNSDSRFISCPHLLWNRRPHTIVRGVAQASRPGKFPAASGWWEQCYRMQMSLISHLLSEIVVRPLPLPFPLRWSLTIADRYHRCLTMISLSLFSGPTPLTLIHLTLCTIVACLTDTFLSICPLRVFLYLPAHYGILYRSAVPDERVDRGLSVDPQSTWWNRKRRSRVTERSIVSLLWPA